MKRKNKNTKFMKFIDAVTSKSLKALMITIPLNIAMYSIDITAQDVYAQIDSVRAMEVQAVEISKPEKQADVSSPAIKSNKEIVWTILTEEGKLSFDEAINFMAVIKCESNFSQHAVNMESGDFGVVQLNEHWQKKNAEKWYLERYGVHREFRDIAFDLYAATRYALYMYETQGLQPWVCSW